MVVLFLIANCKCKLDTCTVELSESERRSGWKPLASVLGDAAAAFGCINRVEELVKQFLRGAVAKLLARPSVQFISCSQDIPFRADCNDMPRTHPYANSPKSPSGTGSRRRRLCSVGNHKAQQTSAHRRRFGRAIHSCAAAPAPAAP